VIEKESLQSKNKSPKRKPVRTLPLSREKMNPAAFLSFLFTAVLLTVLYTILKFYPFGEYSILVSDLGAQYAPDLIAYKNQLLSGELSSYSFQIGMGKNVFGLFAYYLSSPLSFLTFLFPTAMISEAILVLISVKLSLAAALMTLFLSRRFRTRSRFTIVFGIMYAFCSYAAIYMINIMWLDGFLLLPLLMVFIEQYLEDSRCWWRVALTLFVLFVSGFYIAYMVGIFSFLYLLVRLIEEKQLTGDSAPKARRTVFAFIGTAILSAGMSAAVLLPAGMDILGNPDQTANRIALESNFKFLDFLNQLLAGSFDSLSHNKPLVYCGLPVLFLCILFFMNPYFTKKQKGLAAGSITFFILSFNLSFMDLAWQLFDSPNWFLYRYSFLFVFVVLVIAFASLLHLKKVKPKSFVITGIVFLLLLFVVQGFGDLAKAGDRFYLNLVVGALEILCLYAMTEVVFPPDIANLKRLVPALFVILICMEVVCVNSLYMRNVFGGGVLREPLAAAITEGEELVLAAKADGEDQSGVMYRMEIDGVISDALYPIYAGLYLDYPSISTFNSSANKDLNRFLKQLGYDTNYNYFTSSHTYTSPVTDSLLGIRYILSSEKNCSGYELMGTSNSGDLFLLKNTQSLPIMYLVKADASSFDFFALEKNPENKDLFHFQDEFLVSLFGREAFVEPVYNPVKVSSPAIYNALVMEGEPKPVKSSEDAEKSTDDSILTDTSSIEDTDLLGVEPLGQKLEYGTTYLRMSSEDVISLNYFVKIEREDPLFVSIPAIALNDQADVYVNGEYKSELSSSAYTQILSLGSYETGESVTVSIRVNTDTYSSLPVLFYYCNTSLFEDELAAAVAGQDVKLLETKNGYVSAEITAQKDQLLLTTIPYEKGWTLWVDDAETDITPYQNTLISVPVSQGTHTIVMSFTSPGLTAGVITSCISLLLFSGALVFTYRKRSDSI